MIAIVLAVEDEIRDYLSQGGFAVSSDDGMMHLSRRKAGVVVAIGGVGRINAEAATRRVVEEFRPALLVSAGLAGGATPGLWTGDIVLCDDVLVPVGDVVADPGAVGEWLVAPSDLLGVRHSVGRCVTVTAPVLLASEKRRIGDEHSATVIDMESFWMSRLASRYELPHVVVRSVLDPVGQTMPAFITAAMEQGALARWTRAARHLAGRPRDLPSVLRLASQLKTARASLAAALNTLRAETVEPRRAEMSWVS